MSIPHRKTCISLTVSRKHMDQMVELIKTGKFSSISDIVNVSVSLFLGKLTVYEMDSSFNYLTFIATYQVDDSPCEKISVSYSEYVNEELTRLSLLTHKNKSYLVRVTLDNFFEYHKNKTNRFKKSEISKKAKDFDVAALSLDELKDFLSGILQDIQNSEN